MQCRIVCLSRWPIYISFFDYQQNPCYFYLDASLFQSALFSLTICRHKLFFHWYGRSYNRSPSIVVRLLLVPSPLIYFGFPGQTSLLATESAVLISKSEATLIQLMFSTKWDPTPLQTSGALKPLISPYSARFP